MKSQTQLQYWIPSLCSFCFRFIFEFVSNFSCLLGQYKSYLSWVFYTGLDILWLGGDVFLGWILVLIFGRINHLAELDLTKKFGQSKYICSLLIICDKFRCERAKYFVLFFFLKWLNIKAETKILM